MGSPYTCARAFVLASLGRSASAKLPALPVLFAGDEQLGVGGGPFVDGLFPRGSGEDPLIFPLRVLEGSRGESVAVSGVKWNALRGHDLAAVVSVTFLEEHARGILSVIG